MTEMDIKEWWKYLTNMKENADRIYVRSKVNGRWDNARLSEVTGQEALDYIVQWFSQKYYHQLVAAKVYPIQDPTK